MQRKRAPRHNSLSLGDEHALALNTRVHLWRESDTFSCSNRPPSKPLTSQDNCAYKFRHIECNPQSWASYSRLKTTMYREYSLQYPNYPHSSLTSRNLLWAVTSGVGCGVCFLVLSVIAVAMIHPASKHQLDRVSFRIMIYALAAK